MRPTLMVAFTSVGLAIPVPSASTAHDDGKPRRGFPARVEAHETAVLVWQLGFGDQLRFARLVEMRLPCGDSTKP